MVRKLSDYPTTLRLHRRIHDELRHYAKSLSRSVSWVINEILRDPQCETATNWRARIAGKM